MTTLTLSPMDDFSAETYELIGRIALASTNLEAIIGSLSNFEWEGKKSTGNESLAVTSQIIDALRETMKELSLEAGLPNLLLWEKYVSEVKSALNERNMIVHSYKIYDEGKLKLHHSRSNSIFEPNIEFLTQVLLRLQKLEIDGWFRIVGLKRNIVEILSSTPDE